MDLAKKIAELKGKKTADLSADEDLSLAVMNLVSLEEHFFFTANKTGKDSYLELLDHAREVRKKLLARLMPNNEGETWCISKHLLAATMRIFEVGTKQQTLGNKKEAKQLFELAYQVYSLFWGIKLGLIDTKGAVAKTDILPDKPWSYQDLVNKLVDCCRE